jgi:signal transduction histidine kinase
MGRIARRARRLTRNLLDGGVRPPDPRSRDVNYMRRMRTLNLITFGLLGACPMTVVLLLLSDGAVSLLPIMLVAALGTIACVGVRHGMPLNVGTHIVVAIIMAILVVRQAELGGLEMVGQAWTYLPPIIAGLMLGTRGAAAYTLLLSVQIAGFAWLQSRGVAFPIPIPRDTYFVYTAGVQILCGWAFFVLIYAFLAAQRAAEQRLLQLNRRLARSRDRAQDATRAKSQFLANVSHEIRTPMNVIFGMTEIVESEGALNEEQRHCLARTRNAASTLLTLVDDVLDVSRIEAGKLTLNAVETSLHALLAEVADLLRPRAESKGLDLTCRVAAEIPPRLVTDPVRLRQIITNLLGNAIKFTDRGHVALDARMMVETPLGATVLISVADTGIGIPPERHGAIFESFTQADGSSTRRFGGTGLGLTICRDLVRLMKGTLEVLSEPGLGSDFRVVLFLDKPAAGRGVQGDAPRDRASDDARSHTAGAHETPSSHDAAGGR